MAWQIMELKYLPLFELTSTFDNDNTNIETLFFISKSSSLLVFRAELMCLKWKIRM
jgi:hypothetical protein